MSDKIFVPFSKATQEVFKRLLDLDATTGAPGTIESIPASNDKINIMIGLTGDFSGEIYYCFPKKTTLEMVKIMSGMEIDEIDDFVASAMGEIANIISGNALTGLSEEKISCDILPPKIIVGDTASLSADGEECRIINAGIHTAIGDIDLDIKLKGAG